jgi:hypothetical protein
MEGGSNRARRRIHNSGDFLVGTVREEAKHHDRPFAFVQLHDGLINCRPVWSVVFCE